MSQILGLLAQQFSKNIPTCLLNSACSFNWFSKNMLPCSLNTDRSSNRDLRVFTLSDFSSIFPQNFLQPIKAQDLNSNFSPQAITSSRQKLRGKRMKNWIDVYLDKPFCEKSYLFPRILSAFSLGISGYCIHILDQLVTKSSHSFQD